MDSGKNNVVTDALIFKIEEYDCENNELDTTLFIFYDARTDHYVLRGKRTETSFSKSKEYSFECDASKRSGLLDFIQLVIDKKNYVSLVFYNYDNLPEYSNEVTYDFLSKNEENTYEITGYDRVKSTRSNIMKYLRALRSVFNYY